MILAEDEPFLEEKKKRQLEGMLNNLVYGGYQTFVLFGGGCIVEYSLFVLEELKNDGCVIQRYIIKDNSNQNLCRILMFFNRVDQVCLAPDVHSEKFTLDGKKRKMIALADGILLHHEHILYCQEFRSFAANNKKEIFKLF